MNLWASNSKFFLPEPHYREREKTSALIVLQPQRLHRYSVVDVETATPMLLLGS
jgi:hypothetical protein